jgi:hypothetical protein
MGGKLKSAKANKFLNSRGFLINYVQDLLRVTLSEVFGEIRINIEFPAEDMLLPPRLAIYEELDDKHE